MCTHSFCLLLAAAIGQLGLPSETPSSDLRPAASLPTFQQSELSSPTPEDAGPITETTPPLRFPSAYGDRAEQPTSPDPYSTPSNTASAPIASFSADDRAATAEIPATADIAATADFADVTTSDAASSLIARLSVWLESKPVEGTEVGLRNIVRGVSAREQQTAAVATYWDLFEHLAAYHYAADEASFFQGLPAPRTMYQQALLEAREASARAETATALVTVIQAQQALFETAPFGFDGNLPLPADTPCVSNYRTYFKVLNDRGAVPDGLRQVDQLLPVMHASIQALATAVSAAEDALAATRQGYEAGQAALEDLLDTHERLSRRRREFLSAVSRYNEQIARYAFSVSLPGATPDRMVGMLIEQPGAERSVLAAKRRVGDAQRASHEEEIPAPSEMQPE